MKQSIKIDLQTEDTAPKEMLKRVLVVAKIVNAALTTKKALKHKDR